MALAGACACVATACTNGGVIDIVGPGADAGADAAALPPTFVGSVDGTDARLGLVVENGKALLFFCGGPQTYATHTKWFRGAMSLAAPFTLAQTGWTAAGKLDADGRTVRGTLDRGDGNPLTWSAASVAAGTDAGLYEATLPEGTAALIVLQGAPSDAPLLQGAFKNASNVIQQVVPVQKAPQGGFEVSVQVGGAPQSFVMTRAHPF